MPLVPRSSDSTLAVRPESWAEYLPESRFQASHAAASLGIETSWMRTPVCVAACASELGAASGAFALATWVDVSGVFAEVSVAGLLVVAAAFAVVTALAPVVAGLLVAAASVTVLDSQS